MHSKKKTTERKKVNNPNQKTQKATKMSSPQPMDVDPPKQGSNESAQSEPPVPPPSSSTIEKGQSLGDVPMTTLRISDSNATALLSSVQGSIADATTDHTNNNNDDDNDHSPLNQSSSGEDCGQSSSSLTSSSALTSGPPTSTAVSNESMDDSDDSDSSSDDSDDVPLIQVMKQSIPSPGSVASSSKTSVSARSTPSSIQSLKKKPKRPRLASKRKKPFVDSEDEDSDDASSSEDQTLIPAATRELPKYERTVSSHSKSKPSSSSSSSTSNRGSSKRSSTSRKSGVSSSRKRSKLNSGRSSASSSSSGGRSVSVMSGFVTKEVYRASDYPRKPSVIPLESDKNAVEWWNRLDELSDTVKWQTLDHNGVVFAPPYVPHNVKMLYDGQPIDLTPDQEEVATMFAVMIETDYASKPRFRENFMKEFRKILVNPEQRIRHPQIKDLNKCDFTAIKQWYDHDREQLAMKRKSKEYREEMKRLKEESDSLYGFAIVDGIRERVSNYKVEPPGLFRGRGDHPKTGLLKKRLMPEDIILNIGKESKIPMCPMIGHDWGGIIHDQSVTYIAKWIENINGSHKFVYLHASSRFKGEADVKKYNKARELKTHIHKIRKDYESKLRSKERFSRQLATAVWIIDRLAIRIGNEKDTDEEADTVGVCSLRVEHIKFHDPRPLSLSSSMSDEIVAEGEVGSDSKANDDENNANNDGESPLNGGTNNAGCAMQSSDYGGTPGMIYKITLDFLGKDSMRYLQTVIVPGIIYENLRVFCAKKNGDHSILEKIESSQVNTYLKEHMDGLSAKVFRTYNASITLETELNKSYHSQTGEITADSPLADKIFFYNHCNREVAVLCNHQRSVSKSHESQLEKVRDQIAEMTKEMKNLSSQLKKARKIVRKGEKLPMIEVLDDDGNVLRKKKMRSPEQLERALERKKAQLRKKELDLETKKDNKEIALGTSKINYMDPRVTAAWCKRFEVPIEKVFNKSLLEKFPWAMAVDPGYQF